MMNIKLLSEIRIVLKILTKFNNYYNNLKAEKTTHDNDKEIFWKIHKLNWEKNKFIFDLRFRKKKLSTFTYRFLIQNFFIDYNLHILWRLKGYEILCSILVISIHDGFKNKSICRIPLLLRSSIKRIVMDINTGCISCANVDGIKNKPIWWNSKY